MHSTLPFVAHAAGRFAAGIRRAQSSRWYRAMETRLHCAALQTTGLAALELATMAQNCRTLAVAS